MSVPWNGGYRDWFAAAATTLRMWGEVPYDSALVRRAALAAVDERGSMNAKLEALKRTFRRALSPANMAYWGA